MIRTLSFEKDPNGKWYVVLPEWEQDRSALQMVAGADTWLDILSEDEPFISLRVSNQSFPDADGRLTMLKYGTESSTESEVGAWYSIGEYKGIIHNMDIWLCGVTKFVFGHFPENIYYS